MLVPRLRVTSGAGIALFIILSLALRFPCIASGQAQIEPTIGQPRQDAFEPLPNFDLRLLQRQNSAADVEIKKTLLSSGIRRQQVILRWDEQMDLPHHLFSINGPLTPASSDDPVSISKRFVDENRAMFGISSAQLESARVSDLGTTSSFARVALEQQANGIRVFDGDMLFIIDSSGRIVSESGSFIPEIEKLAPEVRATLGAEDAIRRAASACGTELTLPLESKIDSVVASPGRTRFSSAEVDGRSETSLVYYAVTRKDVRLAYQVMLYAVPSYLDAYLILLDANTGELLRRDSLTYAFAAPMSRVFIGESPAVSSTRELVALAGDSAASPNGWVFGGVSAGNNAQVYFNPDLSGGEFIAANSDGNFDFPIDLTPGRSPLNSSNASGANLFYWVNYAHDRFYTLGFNEASRNFQANNFGKGGRDADPVRAETLRGAALDPAKASMPVRNNAYFQGGVDGMQPLLAMLMWTDTVNGQSVDLDSSYDAGVILHEYTHGVSTRLAGTDSSVGLRSLQGSGMGEGWSDFFAMSFLNGPSLLLGSSVATGSYVAQRARGVRNYPYSTSFSVNPLTFGDVGCNTEVHAQGTIWCTMLWELREAMIERYGFSAGRTAAERLVIDGLRTTPLIPTFVDARDAILLADRTTNNGANQDLIWRSFARRGLGKSAATQLTTPIAGLRMTVTEGYDVPPEVTAGSLFINDKPSAAVIGEPLPVVVADRDLSSATSVEVTATNSRTGETARFVLPQTSPGRFAGDVRLVAPGVDGGPASKLVAQPGDEISLKYANARNASGVAETVEIKTIAGRRITLYAQDFETGSSDWQLTSLWHLTSRRESAGLHSLYFAKQKGNKESKSNTPAGSSGAVYSPLVNLQGLDRPQLEFDYLFSGALQGDSSNPDGDLLTITLRNSPFFGASPLGPDDPLLSMTYDLRPQADDVFHPSRIDLRFLGSQYACLTMQFAASLADLKRKKLEGFYCDNIRVTAVTTQ
jgi:fungalysin metallopeptidase (M36)